MTSELNTGADEGASVVTPTSQSPQVSFNAELLTRREELKMSLSDVSHRLRLQPRQIEALESGDYSNLPGNAFVRGALRAYGRLLGVDVTPLLESVGGYAKPAELVDRGTLRSPMPRPGAPLDFGSSEASSRRPWLLWAVLGVVGIVALSFFVDPSGVERVPAAPAPGANTAGVKSPVPAAGSAQPSAAPSPAHVAKAGTDSPANEAANPPNTASRPNETVPPTIADNLAKPTEPDPSNGAAPVAAADSTAQAGTSTPNPADAAPSAAGDAKLRLTMVADAWVEVRQLRDNKVLLQGTKKANSSHAVSTVGPVRVTIANADKVKFEYRGKPFDTSPYRRNNVARIELKD